jgi:hypothetical protein
MSPTALKDPAQGGVECLGSCFTRCLIRDFITWRSVCIIHGDYPLGQCFRTETLMQDHSPVGKRDFPTLQLSNTVSKCQIAFPL